MRLQGTGLVWLAGLAVAFASVAWAEEGAPPGAGENPKRPVRDRAGKGDGLRPGAPGPGILGADIPAIRDELKRHAEAMKALLEESRGLAQQVRQEVRELRKEGGERPPLDDIVKKHSQQAEELATKMADLLATHHENLAKIYKEKQGDVVKKLAEDMLKRMAQRGGPDGTNRPDGPGRRDGRGPRNRGNAPGAEPPPKAAPENF
jgi:hypothetical protein